MHHSLHKGSLQGDLYYFTSTTFLNFLSQSPIRHQMIKKNPLAGIKNVCRLVLTYFACQNLDPFYDRVN